MKKLAVQDFQPFVEKSSCPMLPMNVCVPLSVCLCVGACISYYLSRLCCQHLRSKSSRCKPLPERVHAVLQKRHVCHLFNMYATKQNWPRTLHELAKSTSGMTLLHMRGRNKHPTHKKVSPSRVFREPERLWSRSRVDEDEKKPRLQSADVRLRNVDSPPVTRAEPSLLKLSQGL